MGKTPIWKWLEHSWKSKLTINLTSEVEFVFLKNYGNNGATFFFSASIY